MNKWIVLTLNTQVMLALALVSWMGCRRANGDDGTPLHSPERITVSDDGRSITIPAAGGGLQQIATSGARKGTVLIPVIAPARVVASILPSRPGGGKVVLFESPEVTALYSQYRQSQANLQRSRKSLARVRDMFTNQAATGKDLTDAETDSVTAHAATSEYETRLQALGFNPAEIETSAPGRVWLICDVTEEQLHDVRKGERVEIMFTSYPERQFNGTVEALGAVIDPATRTVKVRVTTPNPDGKLLAGMFARVNFGDRADGVIVLPSSAVVTVEGKDYVFVQTAQGEFQRRRVTLLNSDAAKVVVLEGIDDGDRVVTSGAMLLKGLSFGY